MNWKLKLIWLMVGCSGLTTTSGQTIVPRKTPELLIIGDGLSGNSAREYEDLRLFIVNYSDDTLKYWGSSCHPTKFFRVTFSRYMHLVDIPCRDSAIEVVKIPPRRSQLFHIKLLIDKEPIETIKLVVRMNFYPYFNSNCFEDDIKDRKPILLKDNITLRYEKNGSKLYTWSDGAKEEKKIERNLPSTNFHLLTNLERKWYTITADQSKINTTIATGSSFAGKKAFLVPVTVNNNSEDTLKYRSMTCSWLEYYHIDSKFLEILFPRCLGNMSDIRTIPPHQSHTDIVPLIFKKNNATTIPRFKIGLNINTGTSKQLFAFDEDDELIKYNIVWSNEISIKNSP